MRAKTIIKGDKEEGKYSILGCGRGISRETKGTFVEVSNQPDSELKSRRTSLTAEMVSVSASPKRRRSSANIRWEIETLFPFREKGFQSPLSTTASIFSDKISMHIMKR